MKRLLGIAAAAVALAAPTSAATKPVTFSGNGNRTIAVVRLPADSVVRWTASGRRFAMTSGKLRVSGRAKAGQTFAMRGTYRRVVVRAKGKWTVTFHALAPPKQ